jgi:hypothetical protein
LPLLGRGGCCSFRRRRLLLACLLGILVICHNKIS